jgi:hypothetical protein
MAPGVPREAQQLVCVCADEFGDVKDFGQYCQAAGAIAKTLKLRVLFQINSGPRGVS